MANANAGTNAKLNADVKPTSVIAQAAVPEIKVSDSIPIPKTVKSVYRFGEILKEVGQSFFVSWESDPAVRANLLYAVNRYKKINPGYGFLTKSVVEDGVKGTRIWLTAKPSATASATPSATAPAPPAAPPNTTAKLNKKSA